MRITFWEDDFEADAMDAAKEEMIKQAIREAADKHLEPLVQKHLAEKSPVFFTPHCPECMGNKAVLIMSHGVFLCDDCGYQRRDGEAVMLRPLAPCPAPPYTREEIEGLL